MQRNVHGRLNGSWKICSLAVNGQSFLVIDGYLLKSLFFFLETSLFHGRHSLRIPEDQRNVHHEELSVIGVNIFIQQYKSRKYLDSYETHTLETIFFSTNKL